MNMPENHDTDFNWPDFVEKVNSELIAAYGNFVHRVLTLGARFCPANQERPLPSCRPTSNRRATSAARRGLP